MLLLSKNDGEAKGEDSMKTYPHAVVIVTLACNLKCKHCILCAPYYKRPFHPTTDFIKETAERAFKLGNYRIFEYMGGEPLLRDDLPDIWEYNREHFYQKAEIFKTVTNGSIRIWDDLLDVWKNYGTKIHIIIDDYGPELSIFAQENYERLKANGISCERRNLYNNECHHGGWADFIAPEKPFRDEKDAAKTYLECANAQKLQHCCNIINGLMMPCHMQFQLNDRGIVDAKNAVFADQCIDLFDDTETWERKRAKMDLFTNAEKLPYLEACRYCPGFSDSTPRLKPAIQVERMDQLSFRMDTSKGHIYSQK